jgi:PKD repeat protein
MGDYIAIAARGGMVYPGWPDNRAGNVLTYVSAYSLGGGGNLPPVAEANGPYTGIEGVPVNFSSAGSSDPDGSIVAYLWDFGDGNTSNSANPSHTYASAGLYNVSLTVTDDDGAEDTDNTTADIDEMGGGGIPCTDVAQLQARCRTNVTIKILVRFTSSIHSGKSIDVTVNGTDVYSGLVQGNRAVIQTGPYGSGNHTVALTDPDCPQFTTQAACASAQEDLLAWDEELLWEDELALLQSLNGPVTTSLKGNYPNPFNPSTTISYTLAADTYVTLKVYNTLGQEVASLVDGDLAAGLHTAVWNGRAQDGAQVASGIYLYRLVAGDVVQTQKMMLMK